MGIGLGAAAVVRIVFSSAIIGLSIWVIIVDWQTRRGVLDFTLRFIAIIGAFGFAFVLRYYIGITSGALTPADAPRILRWPDISIDIAYAALLLLYRHQRGLVIYLRQFLKVAQTEKASLIDKITFLNLRLNDEKTARVEAEKVAQYWRGRFEQSEAQNGQGG